MSRKTKIKTASSIGVQKLTTWQLICLNALSMPVAMAGLVLVTFIPTYYATELGLGLGAVGAVFVFGRLLDVVTDPLIGFFSDQTQSRFGPRTPWMMLGLPGFCLAAWLLFAPPENASLLYLICASGLYFLFYTILDIPYSSIGLEISPHVHERSVIASFKALFQVMGALCAALIPLIFLEQTGASLSFTVKLVFVFSILGLSLFLIFVPRRDRIIKAPRRGFLTSLKITWASRPYRYLIGSFLIVQTANSLTIGLTVLFVTHIIGAPELIGAFVGLVILSSAFFLPIWVWISKRYSKKRAWTMSLITGSLVLATTPFLNQGDIIPFATLCAVLGAAIGCDAIMPTSILADIVYDGEETRDQRHAGLYLAMKNSVSKLTFIAPMGLAFPILDGVGFVSGEDNSSSALTTLLFFYAALPILLRLIAIFIIRKMPETESLFT